MKNNFHETDMTLMNWSDHLVTCHRGTKHLLLPPTMNSCTMMYNQFVGILVLFIGRQEDSVLPGR
jgi:hypothetical protein